MRKFARRLQQRGLHTIRLHDVPYGPAVSLEFRIDLSQLACGFCRLYGFDSCHYSPPRFLNSGFNHSSHFKFTAPDEPLTVFIDSKWLDFDDFDFQISN